jgi:hypothetical protein
MHDLGRHLPVPWALRGAKYPQLRNPPEEKEHWSALPVKPAGERKKEQ